MKNAVFWDVARVRIDVSEKYRLRHQGRRNQRAGKVSSN
jgi:hypothetical protein